MKGITFQGKDAVRYETVADPEIREPGDAVLRVTLSTICGSDLHVFHEREKGQDPGTVMGHEFMGEVVGTGPEVAQFHAGDRVVVPFSTNCGRCSFCRGGLTARCVKSQLFGWIHDGAGLHGGQAEYVRVPTADATMVAVPDDLPPEQVLLAGDILSTGNFAAEMGDVGPDSTVAILGCGPVGLLSIVGARERGAKRIFSIDRIPERLRLAESFGATPVHLESDDPGGAVREATEGRGADAVLEVVGSPQATRLAYDLVRPGGTIAAAGVHTEPHFAFSPNDAYDRNLTYRAGRCPARRFMPQALEIVRSGKYDLSPLFTHRLPLSEGARAYDLFANRKDGCLKVLLAP